MVETKGKAKTIFRNPETDQTAAVDWAGPIEASRSRRGLQRRRRRRPSSGSQCHTRPRSEKYV
eukprot:scaffold101125_cov66-Cyclotella_meneghiniana.AAC.3